MKVGAIHLAGALQVGRVVLAAATAAIGCLLPQADARAADFHQVVIYTDDDPPYVTVDRNYHVSGGSAFLKVRQVLAKLKLSPAMINVVPWARGYDEARLRPGVMIFPVVRTPERMQYLTFVFKIQDAQVYFYRLSTRNDIALHVLDDAKPYSICVVRGDYRAEFLAQSGFAKLDMTSDSTVNVERLIHGRCDLLLSTEAGMQSKLEALRGSRTQVVRSIPLNELDNALYAAFNKDTDPAVINAFREAAADPQH